MEQNYERMREEQNGRKIEKEKEINWKEKERKRNMHAPWTRKRRPKRFVTPLVSTLSYRNTDYIIYMCIFFNTYSLICISYIIF